MFFGVPFAVAAPSTHQAELDAAWRSYVEVYVSADGRVMDPSAGSITTSEGQAYALVRAVWADDRATFERALRWTRDNLQSGEPTRLPAWKWGERPDGTWGILDTSPASDADQLIAWALLMAAERWRRPEWKELARGLMATIWAEEVRPIGKRHVMLPGPWAAGMTPVMVNPSYFLPFAWRSFARVDREHPWARLVGDAYALWDATLSPAGLPPDWAWLDASTGAIVGPPAGEEERRTFGFEAFRVLWTLAAEAEWYREPRARALLGKADRLRTDWLARQTLPARVTWEGDPAVEWSFLGMYGALLPAWETRNPDDAQRLYDLAILPARHTEGWGNRGDYYTQNWVWLGLALWSDLARPPKGSR